MARGRWHAHDRGLPRQGFSCAIEDLGAFMRGCGRPERLKGVKRSIQGFEIEADV